MRKISILLSFLFLIQGCAAPYWKYDRGEEVHRLTAIELNYYQYPDLKIENFSKKLIEDKRKYRRYEIEFDLLFPQGLEPQDSETIIKEIAALELTDPKKARNQELIFKNRLNYYLPANLKTGEKRPVIIISPIMGGNMIVDWFAEYYAKKGFIAVIVHRQKLYWREGHGLEQIEDYMRMSLIRIRQALDWILMQPEVNSERVGSFGISYGAIMHTMLAAVEERIDYHILAMPAGPLPEVILNCPEKAIIRVMKSAQKDLGLTEEEVASQLRFILKTDPYLLAPYTPRDKIEVYVSLFDQVVKTKNIFNLWREMDEPKLSWIPLGHYGGILLLPWLQRKSFASFKKHLSF